MQYKIYPPQTLRATVKLPPSKSISNRILILNALSLNTDLTKNLSDCEDTQVMIDAFNSDSNVFDVKNSGTAMRFLTAFLAGMEGEWIIKGSPRMRERPIYPLVDTLLSLGGDIEYMEKQGFPPLKINGKRLQGGEVHLKGDISSQFSSALLMIAPTMDKGLTIHIDNKIVSKPYINLTIKLMSEYGVLSKWKDNDIIVKPQTYRATTIQIESDWSAASYWYEMVALSPSAEVTLLGLKNDSSQGDFKLVSMFEDLGVNSHFIPEGVIIKNTGKLAKKVFYNFIDEPDLVQTFATTCSFLNIPFIFSGIENLRIKETDRVRALKTELMKLGYVLKETGNEMLEWSGERCPLPENRVIETYDDHRMALSFTPAALKTGSIEINNPKVVIKSYPDFWDDIQNAGFIIEEK